MIKTASNIQSRPKQDSIFEITASLLNQWERIFIAKDYVKEAEGDAISLEEKQDNKTAEAYQQFVDALKRVPQEKTEAMQKGIDYEASVYADKDEVFSPIVKNGEFQAAYKKLVRINGMNIMLYGILDCLKAGRIYDIKRVGRYSSGKYKESHQHSMYLYLVPEARDFTYLVCDDNGNHHLERYERCNCEDILQTISTFLTWLQSNNLFEDYKANWDWNRKKHQ